MLFVTDSTYSENITNEALKWFGDFKLGGQVIRTVIYVDGIVLLAKEETVLQGMIDRLIGTVRCYGVKINVENLRQ